MCSFVQPLRAGRVLDTPRQAARFVSLLAFEKLPMLGGNRAESWTSTYGFLCAGKGVIIRLVSFFNFSCRKVLNLEIDFGSSHFVYCPLEWMFKQWNRPFYDENVTNSVSQQKLYCIIVCLYGCFSLSYVLSTCFQMLLSQGLTPNVRFSLFSMKQPCLKQVFCSKLYVRKYLFIFFPSSVAKILALFPRYILTLPLKGKSTFLRVSIWIVGRWKSCVTAVQFATWLRNECVRVHWKQSEELGSQLGRNYWHRWCCGVLGELNSPKVG